jgi:hypothetical protein
LTEREKEVTIKGNEKGHEREEKREKKAAVC